MDYFVYSSTKTDQILLIQFDWVLKNNFGFIFLMIKFLNLCNDQLITNQNDLNWLDFWTVNLK